MKTPSVLAALCVLVLSLTVAVPAMAEPNATASNEIEHLLKFVTDSNAEFIRNGDSHEAEAAAEHIRAKYDHYREKIATTEDFVRLAATKSALSGRAYQVRLEDGTMKATSEWLLAELKRLREARDAAQEKTDAGADGSAGE